MLNITSIDNNLSVYNMATVDSMGQPSIEVQLSAPGVTALEGQVQALAKRLNNIEQQREFDMALIMNNPALKDAYEQYRVMLNLVKTK